jgi:anaerobic magnesium-protoporphyrin IX monomethyl ester cyclase
MAVTRILHVKGASFNREVPQFSYPLGLMYLASFLRAQDPGHEQRILDLRCERRPSDSLQRFISEFDPAVVAVSALTCEAESLHQVAREAKAHNSRTLVVAGGPHISACTDDVIADVNVDVLVVGEGEESFADVVGTWADSGEARGIPGTAWRQNGEVRWGPHRPPVADLDALPYPAWDLVDINRHARFGRAGNLRRGRFMPVFTSRGCPYQCVYCHNIFGKRFRARSAGNVVEEVRQLTERYGVTDIEIYDDIFNQDLARAKAICHGLLQTGVEYRLAFPNGVRADRMDRELVDLLARVGTTNLAVAVETASTRLQKAIHKNLNLDRVNEAITWADNDGIVTNGYFMLGFPTETREEIEETIRYAAATNLFFASFFIVTPYPGTCLWDETVKKQGSSSLDFRDYNYLSGYFNLSEVDGEELRRLQREAYWRFYTRKAFKILLATPRLRLDWRNAAWLWTRRMLDRGRLRGS